MKVLVVGSGGREHAIVKKLRESPRITELYAAPGNGGISRDAECVDIRATDIPAMVAFAEEKSIDFVVVAPDDPLVMGMVDALSEKGFRCFGPDKAAARIEGSKVFSKAFMKKYGIPTAAHEAFSELGKAYAYAENTAYPIWIKTDGLALGKGAVIAENSREAKEILESLMSGRAFGDSGRRVVIEEHMTGPEVTVLLFSDGETIAPMVSSMDHKRALDNNEGLNTGGMGVVAPNPHYTPDIAAQCMEEIFLPTINGMKTEGYPFRGCLYVGLMLTPAGPKVIEYNCRFGDPEAQAVLSLLETDLFDIMEATCDGTLSGLEVRWSSGASACVVMASGGYPEAYETGFPISGLDNAGGVPGATVCHAGTKYFDNAYYTAGGRVLSATATAETLPEAVSKAYAVVDRISFSHAHYRKDIGNY